MNSFYESKTNNYRTRKTINKIYLTFSLLLFAWYIIPSIRMLFRYPPVAVVAFLLILVSFVTIKNNQVFITKVLILCGILAILYLLVPYPLNLKKALNIFQQQIIYFAPMFIFQYFVSKEDKPAIKILFIILSIMFLFVLVKTIGEMQINPRVARDLASGRQDYELDALRARNIGGFGFSYAIGMLATFLFNLFIRMQSKKIKSMALITFLLSFYYIIRAQYAIIFIIVLGACVFSLFYKIKNISLKIVIMLFMFIIILFLPNIFFMLARVINGTELSIRFYSVALFLTEGVMEADLFARFTFYTNGILLFLKSPIWGITGIEQSPYYIDFISSHSTIIGIACETGIIGLGIYLYNIFSNRNYLSKEFAKIGVDNSLFIVPFNTLLILMFFNPTFETMELSVTLFIYIPSIIYLYSNRKINEK